jgi:hypothetical protein
MIKHIVLEKELKHVILEKAQVKGFTRVRRGRTEQVKGYSRIQAAMKEYEKDVLKRVKEATNKGELFKFGLYPGMKNYKAMDRLVAQGKVQHVPPKGVKSGGYMVKESKTFKMEGGEVAPKSLNVALDHLRNGGTLYVATQMRVYTLNKKTLEKFDAANTYLLKEEGNGYRMKVGKNSVYLFPGQLRYGEAGKTFKMEPGVTEENRGNLFKVKYKKGDKTVAMTVRAVNEEHAKQLVGERKGAEAIIGAEPSAMAWEPVEPYGVEGLSNKLKELESQGKKGTPEWEDTKDDWVNAQNESKTFKMEGEKPELKTTKYGKIITGVKFADDDGVEKEVFIEHRHAKYPYEHEYLKVLAEPTRKGKNTEAYRKTKADLGDDWSTDITDSWYELNTPENRGNIVKIGKVLDQARESFGFNKPWHGNQNVKTFKMEGEGKKRKKSQEKLVHLPISLLQNLLGDRDPDAQDFQEDVKAEIARRGAEPKTFKMEGGKVPEPYGVMPYDPGLKIVNTEQLPRGVGARYLEVMRGQGSDLIAVRWRKIPIYDEGHLLIDMTRR